MAKVAPEDPVTGLVLPKEPDPGTNLDGTKAVKARPRQAALFEFSNTEAIKDKVKSAKFKPPPYDVMNAYHETGFCQFIAKHPYFENCTLSIIIINALWISIDTDGNTAETMLDADAIYITMDVLFFTYFTCEVVVRFCAFKKKCDCLKDGWFKFDFILVLLYAFDPFTIALVVHVQDGGGLNLPTAVLRLFRLARLSRLVRMLRSLPELMIMIKGMVTATTSVGYTLGLLMIVTYVFAIALRNLVPKPLPGDECAEKYGAEMGYDGEAGCLETSFFPSVPEAMHNLIIFGTFCDFLSFLMWAAKAQSPVCMVLLWVYVALANLTVMNMLVGVLCEVISAVAVEEKESMMVDKVHENLGAIMNDLDKNYDGMISWEEFSSLPAMPTALKIIESVNVNPESMVDMAEDLFFEDGEPVSLTFNDFMELILDLRGGQLATVKDLLNVGKRFTRKMQSVTLKVDKIEKTANSRVKAIDNKLDQIISALKKDVSVTSLP